MSAAGSSVNPKNIRWYQGLDRYCWLVLFIAALGWLFDTMDQNLFNLVRSVSIKELLGPGATDASVKQIGGWVTSLFLIGWSVGGFIFGILGDRIGRTGTMILTILIYAVFTGLSGLAQNWETYAFMRFMTGLGVGGEWAAGAALVAEVFPSRSRPMALGALQALSAVGNMMAAVVTFSLAGLSWRYAYAIGAAPALLVLWIRRSVREPEQWKEAKEKASFGKEMGSIGELFRDPTLRRNTVAALLMAIAGQGVLWGVAFWSADMVSGILTPMGLAKADIDRGKSVVFFIQQLGAMLGMYAFAGFSEHTNRRKAFFVWFALAWMAVPAFFWGVAQAAQVQLPGFVTAVLTPITFTGSLPEEARQAVLVAALLAFVMGFSTMGAFSGYTVYFPELYPTRLRATGCGICYNGGRFLAAIIPIATGALAGHFAAQGAIAQGFPMAATVVACVYGLGFLGTLIAPETKGKPLPD